MKTLPASPSFSSHAPLACRGWRDQVRPAECGGGMGGRVRPECVRPEGGWAPPGWGGVLRRGAAVCGGGDAAGRALSGGRARRLRITFWVLPRCGPSWGFA